MTFKPPFARMRQIRRDAPAPLPKMPSNVEEALAEARAKQDAGQVAPDEVRTRVGDVDVVVTPGPDKLFGTRDDQVMLVAPIQEEVGIAVANPENITKIHLQDDPPQVEVMVEVEVEVEAPEAEAEEIPDYSIEWHKATLKALASRLGLSDEGTKAEIVARLDEHYLGA